jgi:hypothetical protein
MAKSRINLDNVAKAAMELQRRKMDALELFRATLVQAEVLRQDVRQFLLRGGNRSGKSITAAVRFASIVRGKPVTAMDGSSIICRAQRQEGRQLLCWVVGLALDHIGQTMHRLLFRAGLFDIVRDKKTGMWRAWNPVTYPEDFDIPKEHRKPSPPLIPPSEIAEWAWEKKAERQFSMCRLKNGTEIYAFASSAPVKAGDPVDEIWIDEEIKFADHYPEWQARLVDNEGRLFWSSWPAHSNSALLRLSKQCDRELREVNDGTRDYVTAKQETLRMSGNPFFTKKQVEDTLSGWSEAERRARDLGEFTTDLIKLYGEFNEDIHCADYDQPELYDELSKVLAANNWVPPADWTRDLILDPGTAHPGLLMFAIPPPNLWHHNEPYFVPYREIYVPRLNADGMARGVLESERGFLFERFYIDGQAARQTPMGFSGTVGSNYSESFARFNLSSRQLPGSGFLPGDPDPVARGLALRQWLRIRPCGRPQLRIIKHMCPNLVEQFRDTTRHITHEDLKEVAAPGEPVDVLVCAEYYASRRPDFVYPRAFKLPKSPADLAWEEEQRFEANSTSRQVNEPICFGAANV